MNFFNGFAICTTFLFVTPAFAVAQNFDIMDGSGKLIGQGSLSENKKGMSTISLDLRGAQPGIHGIHLHEKGLCQGPKFESAGGHLNPDKKKHGHKNSEGPHLGDLGNIEIPANGNLKKEIQVKPFDLSNGASLVIHAKADDEKTDPSGSSGDRIYCAVIATSPSTQTEKTNKK